MGCRARLLAERDYDRKTATTRFAQLLRDVIAENRATSIEHAVPRSCEETERDHSPSGC
jgi:hypothetical protein